MIEYFHRSLDADGKSVSGHIAAASAEEATNRLISQGLTPVEVTDGQGTLWTKLNVPVDLLGRFSKRDVHSLMRDLAQLTEAGLPLERALVLTAETTGNESMAATIKGLHKHVRAGNSFASALAEESALFPAYCVAMVRSAENAGRLPETLADIADMLDRQLSFSERVRSALIYPGLLLVMVVLTLVLVVAVVLPQFGPLFSETEGQLPWITTVVMGFGAAISRFGLMLLVAVIGAAIVAGRLVRTDGGREWLGRTTLRSWMITTPDLIRGVRTLGSALNGGVHLDTALRLAAETVANPVIRADIGKMARTVKTGRYLSSELKDRVWSSPLLLQLVRVGEETGRLGAMLEKAANIMEDNYRIELEKRLNLIGPVLTLVMGGIVALLIGGVLVGMMSISQIVL